jgi:hypothetical protein
MSSLSGSTLKCLLPALVAAAVSSSAWAGPVATRAALDAMLGAGATNENFESYPVASGGLVGVGASLSSTSTPNGQGPGLIAAGVTISTSSGSVTWQGDNFYGLPSKTMGTDVSFDITIDFTAFADAVGVDLLNYGGYPSTYDVTVFALDDTTVLQQFTGYTFPSAVTPLFFGFENAGGIGSLRIDRTSGFGPVIDNLTFGTVPEPASIALVAMSLLALRVSRRR